MAETVQTQQPFGSLRQSDLTDKTLFQLNNKLTFLAEQIAKLQAANDAQKALIDNLIKHPPNAQPVKQLQQVVQNIDSLTVNNQQNITNLTDITNVSNLVDNQTIVYNSVTNVFESASGSSGSFALISALGVTTATIAYLDWGSNPQSIEVMTGIVEFFDTLTFVNGVLS